jgi:outer membrane protein assembly factor BamB
VRSKPIRLTIIIIVFGLVRLSAAAADEWPQFRGPTGQGLSTATNVPLEWSATSNIAWQTRIPGTGWSSPVLSRDRLYLTTAVRASDDSPVSLRALCVSAPDGKILWDVEVFHPNEADTKARHQKNSLASPTPIVRGDRLYVHFGHLGTAALDLAGKILWRQTGIVYPPVHGNGGSPVLAGDILAFSCDGERDPFLIALDAATGDVRWKTPRLTPAKKNFSFSTPLEIQVGDSVQLVSPGSGFVGGYSRKDGHELWRIRYGEGYSVVPRPVFAHGLLFISSGFDHPVLLAIDPKDASGDATEAKVVWTIRKGAPLTPSMLVVGDELYFVSDGGFATCADARTGKIHWSERLRGDFSASPVYADGRIYFQNESGGASVIKPGTTFELLAQNDLGERTFASYAVADGALFIRSESHLWHIGRTGSALLREAR